MKEFTPEQITRIINAVKVTFDDKIRIVDYGQGYSRITGKDDFCKQVAIKLKKMDVKKPKSTIVSQTSDQENKCVPSYWQT